MKITAFLSNIAFFSLILYNPVLSQELMCTAKISAQQVGSDKTIYDAMEKGINEFMNNNKWTSDAFSPEEKIDCSVIINITEKKSANEFKANFQIQCRRPVFNSSYNSTLMLHTDDEISFTFNQFDPLTFSENVYTGELAAILSFYAYMMIGIDYDSFSKFGGTPYYQKALQIVNFSQNSANSGWKNQGVLQSRYWLVNNILDPFFQPLRECLYTYHREGFDIMYINLTEGRNKVTEALKTLEKVHATKPNNYNFQQFFYAKADELTNLYKSAPEPEKLMVTELLKKLNPGNAMKYNRIVTGK